MREFQRPQRIAAAVAERRRGTLAVGRKPGQRSDLGAAQGLQRAALQQPVLRQRLEQPLGPGIVVQLTRPRGAGQQQARDRAAGQQVQQRRRGLVDPLQIVQHQHERAVLGQAAHLPGDAGEQLPAVVRLDGLRFGRIKREAAARLARDERFRQFAQRIGETAVGMHRLGLEAAADSHARTPLLRSGRQRFQHPALADAGLAEHEQHRLRCGQIAGELQDAAPLRVAADERSGRLRAHVGQRNRRRSRSRRAFAADLTQRRAQRIRRRRAHLAAQQLGGPLAVLLGVLLAAALGQHPDQPRMRHLG